jgi:hypothetical protein
MDERAAKQALGSNRASANPARHGRSLPLSKLLNLAERRLVRRARLKSVLSESNSASGSGAPGAAIPMLSASSSPT